VVDRDGLENRCACKRTVGSNPTPSASKSLKSQCFCHFTVSGRCAPNILPIIKADMAPPFAFVCGIASLPNELAYTRSNSPHSVV
jgi:hypothetical protein